MRSARLALCLLCLVGASGAMAQPKPAAPAAPAAGHLKPGLWEVVRAAETAGTSAKSSMVSRVCFSADDVRSAEKILPSPGEFGAKCEARELKLQGETASWRATCVGRESSTSGMAQVTFAGTSYSGSAKVEVKADGKTSKVEQKLTGTWVGECK